MQLKHARIHFIANSSTGDDLDMLRALQWEEGTLACTRHTWVWVVYCQLKMRGWNVSLGYTLESDAINVVHCQTARRSFNALDFQNYFIVGIRADFRPFPYGSFEIVQNRTAEGVGRIFMPLYPQPGLAPRDRTRKGVENVCFAGRLQNSIDLEGLSRDLGVMGCKLVFKGEGHWQEMADVDLLLGIRTFSKEPHHSKPATKLFNAWLAGIPFIGGYDSAFSQVGTPGKDYLRVSSLKELLKAIERLTKDPQLYRKLVRNGERAVQDYLPERVTERWMDFFEGKAIPAYNEWRQKTSPLHRWKSGAMRWRFIVRERWIARLLVLSAWPRP